jgi:hypothetical protein
MSEVSMATLSGDGAREKAGRDGTKASLAETSKHEIKKEKRIVIDPLLLYYRIIYAQVRESCKWMNEWPMSKMMASSSAAVFCSKMSMLTQIVLRLVTERPITATIASPQLIHFTLAADYPSTWHEQHRQPQP